MYRKLSNTDFDVVEHLNANITGETLNTSFRVVHMSNSIEKRETKGKVVSIRATHFDNIQFQDFVQASALHERYLSEIKASMSPSAFLAHLYKAELTGAKVSVIKDKRAVEGIVVEERRNVLVIVHADNSIKMYPKASNRFVLRHDGIRYFFFGDGMKKSRFFKR